MTDSEPKISSLDDLKSSVPILPSDMQKDLGLIAFSNSLELDMAIFQAELDAKEIEEASKGSMVKTAEEQYGGGLYQYSSGNYNQALENFSKAIKANNKFCDGYRERGFNLLGLKKKEGSIIELK